MIFTNISKNYILFVIIFNILKFINSSPQTYYVSIGQDAKLMCNSGSIPCFSTYSFQNTPCPMVMLNSSQKYQIELGAIIIKNIQATDAGFYTCSSSCDQLKYDQISYYVHPLSMGQPIDTSKNWIAIPPLSTSFKDNGLSNNQFYVYVSDERLYASKNSKILSDAEIAGLVIGISLAFIITIAIIIFLILLNRKRNMKRKEKILNSEKMDNTSLNYSTIERDYGDESATNTLTKERNEILNNKNLKEHNQYNQNEIANLSNIVNEITTKNIQGPKTYLGNELNSINKQDLPNIDISFNDKIKQDFSNFDKKYDEPIKPNDMSTEILNQTSTKPRILFPSKFNKAPEDRYVSNDNINLHQIINEAIMNKKTFENNNYPTHNYNDSESISSDKNMDRPKNNLDVSSNQMLNNYENEGGVTIVSARTPSKNDQKLSVLPQNYSTKYSFQQFQQNRNILPNKLSLSERIETTSTPLQKIPTHSLRTGVSSIRENIVDGSTDV